MQKMDKIEDDNFIGRFSININSAAALTQMTTISDAFACRNYFGRN